MKQIIVLLFTLGWFNGYAQDPYIVVLGVAQDAGYPQANCEKKCCQPYWNSTAAKQAVSCLGLVDPGTNSFWLFDATPDFTEQLQQLKELLPTGKLKGIFLTHGHIGHYTGLMYLGREAMGAVKIPVYAMPRMLTFLKENGPWNQLIKLNNIEIVQIEDKKEILVNENISVFPMQVPHRDEFTETVGFKIIGPQKMVLFIPDIDKWEKWEKDIVKQVHAVDAAYLDATFYNNQEIPGRDMSEIPHPFIEESIAKFNQLENEDKNKVNFIHFNHTNPIIQPDSEERRNVIKKGYSVASIGDKFSL